MPKLTPKRTFLLRVTEGKSITAKKGVKIDVTDEEHKRLFNYFEEAPPSVKKKLSVN